MPKIFYQSSMPRAGSTLLQNIMAQNPGFHVTPTSGLLQLIYGARQIYTSSAEFRAQDHATMRKAFLALAREGMTAWAGALTDKPYYLDKSRGWSIHFDLLQMIFGEDPKMICMVRDLRQILASLELKHREHPDRNQSIENHVKMTGTTTFKRALIHLQGPPVGVALDRMFEIHQRGWNKKMLFLRYEDLTTQPEQTLRSVYTYLNLPYYHHNFDQVAQVTTEDDDLYGIPSLHSIRPKVVPMTHDVVQILGISAVRMIEEQWAWYQQLFGYKPIVVS